MPAIVGRRVFGHFARRGAKHKQVKIVFRPPAKIHGFFVFCGVKAQVPPFRFFKNKKRARNVKVPAAKRERAFAERHNAADAPSGGQDSLLRVLVVHIGQHKRHHPDIRKRKGAQKKFARQNIGFAKRRIADNRGAQGVLRQRIRKPVGALNARRVGADVNGDFVFVLYRVRESARARRRFHDQIKRLQTPAQSGQACLHRACFGVILVKIF